jgi:hypothetical protein
MNYEALTDNENAFLRHMMRWGSAGYPVMKLPGRKWIWKEAFGIKGAPTVYSTKRAAMQAIDNYLSVLRDKIAGRY